MASEDRLIWIDGELVPWAQATVHVLSHSFQRGTLVFDFMSVHQTPRGAAIFRLPEHLERFRGSCDLVGLRLEHDLDDLASAIRETVRANPGCGSVKISAYIPSIEVELVPQDDRVRVAIAVYDAREDIVRANVGDFQFRREIRLLIEKDQRNRREDVLSPQAKGASNYGPTMLAKANARRAGYDDVLLLSEDGSLAETPTTNLFLVDRSGALRTPAENCVLHGVTRASLIEIAKAEGFQCLEGSLYPADLLAASEAFLSATSVGVWPVVSVNGMPLSDGKPGPVGLHLLEGSQEDLVGATTNVFYTGSTGWKRKKGITNERRQTVTRQPGEVRHLHAPPLRRPWLHQRGEPYLCRGTGGGTRGARSWNRRPGDGDDAEQPRRFGRVSGGLEDWCNHHSGHTSAGCRRSALHARGLRCGGRAYGTGSRFRRERSDWTASGVCGNCLWSVRQALQVP